jgi:methionyl-tRNA synthetase
LRQIGILCQPFVPESAGKLLDLLGIPVEQRQFAMLGSSNTRLSPGTNLPAPAPVFPRYVEPEAAKA